MEKKNKIYKIFGSIILIFLILFFVILPIATIPRSKLTDLALEWKNSGTYIKWNSTLDVNKDFGELNIFTIQKGNPTNPAILMIHGYPTSSYDFTDLFDLLSADYYVCAIDTIGYGLSDKPKDGYDYSINDDARLIDYYIKNILNLTSLSILTHDKGSSVGFALLELYRNQINYTIDHHFITNGNIYLPLAQLTSFQKIILNENIGPFVTHYINGDLLAKGMNRLAHNFPESDDKVDAIASILDYQDGGEIQHELIKYLNEREENENTWLNNLKNSPIPTTLIWGVDDEIAPLAVADHVWNVALQDRDVESNYWQLPNANHYLQNDQAEVLSLLIRQSLGESVDWGKISTENRPILMG